MNKKYQFYVILATIVGLMFLLLVYLVGWIFNNSSTGENILGKLF